MSDDRRREPPDLTLEQLRSGERLGAPQGRSPAATTGRVNHLEIVVDEIKASARADREAFAARAADIGKRLDGIEKAITDAHERLFTDLGALLAENSRALNTSASALAKAEAALYKVAHVERLATQADDGVEEVKRDLGIEKGERASFTNEVDQKVLSMRAKQIEAGSAEVRRAVDDAKTIVAAGEQIRILRERAPWTRAQRIFAFIGAGAGAVGAAIGALKLLHLLP